VRTYVKTLPRNRLDANSFFLIETLKSNETLHQYF